MSNMDSIKDWYEQLLAQQAADSYLHDLDFFNGREVALRLRMGANHPDHFSNLPKEERSATQMTGGELNGPVGMVNDFQATWEIIDHLPNTSSGFSATLLKHKTTEEYTLSFRSTESKSMDKGGDVDRDSSRGANGQIGSYGFAWGQLRDMQHYYEGLKNGVLATEGSGADIQAYLADPAKKLNVTGYSLGSHLAQVFTLMHADDVGHTLTFNGAGMGSIDGMDTPEALGAALRGRLALLDDIMANPLTYADHVSLTEYDSLGFWLHSTLTKAEMAAQIRDSHDPEANNIYLDPLFRFAIYAMPDDVTGSFATSVGEYLTGEKITFVENMVNLYGYATHNDRNLVAGSGQMYGVFDPIFIEDQEFYSGWDDSPDFLVLLCYKFSLLFCCPQQGHHRSDRAMVRASRKRQVAMAVGSWRCIGPSPARAEAGG